MVSQFWWVRHGPTHARHFVGWTDLPADLSDTAQIARLNAVLPDEALLISSDLLRAQQTADAIEIGARRRLPDDTALREFNFGDWEGCGFQEVSDRDPLLARQFWDEPGDVAPPNGESWRQVANRVSGAVAQLDGLAPDIIIVAHFGAILTQVGACIGQTPQKALAQEIANLSITQIELSGDGPLLRVINDCP